ncbi:hypothetical protein NLB58_02135 [Porphyromonas gingivalis]|uniref:hypothetical protein n=1 Tax=Porphyromonas gingivalis TaxID=837 RepID=UPI00265812BD|nr:hypothetical protein [Porphyromonas gingivalis]MDP0530675.1 hypothetical protein [Porphyromonas gingivalis]MDP0625639.1 hypothetical protein [Porphyromonas gingivalis]WKD51738.1 hypothetical protein NF669_05485 [Porphyromonas gingivalis]WKD53786.1 hypothetical protein NF668_05490 [Porphyromonas gingivalis]
MEECQENKEKGVDYQLHPLIQQFVDPSRIYFQTMDNFSDKWDDSASECFRDEVVDYCRKTTYDFLCSVISLTNGYEQILRQAQNLTEWDAGFGKFLSIIDLEVLAERQVSRWIFKRDDQRW